jgi:hypothetical protein
MFSTLFHCSESGVIPVFFLHVDDIENTRSLKIEFRLSLYTMVTIHNCTPGREYIELYEHVQLLERLNTLSEWFQDALVCTTLKYVLYPQLGILQYPYSDVIRIGSTEENITAICNEQFESPHKLTVKAITRLLEHVRTLR